MKRLLLLLALLCLSLQAHAAPRADVLEFTSTNLLSNPLHDPALRRALICSPDNVASNAACPIVYYLPGFGNSAERFLKNQSFWLTFTEKFSTNVSPIRVVVIDGHNHWGCSQFINSPAQGNYADYICDEIVSRVEARYPLPKSGVRRIIAGHSSGGFGALRLGMMRHDLFDGVVALSPDSYFDVSHLPLVKLPGVTNATLAGVRSLMLAGGSKPLPKDGDFVYALALCAAYAPDTKHPGQFQWLYDEHGKFRAEVWQRWLDNDPLVIAQKNPNAFSPAQSVYLEGAAQDQYKANIGAKAIYDVVRTRKGRFTFREPAGRHGDHQAERLQAGVAWVLGR